MLTISNTKIRKIKKRETIWLRARSSLNNYLKVRMNRLKDISKNSLRSGRIKTMSNFTKLLRCLKIRNSAIKRYQSIWVIIQTQFKSDTQKLNTRKTKEKWKENICKRKFMRPRIQCIKPIGFYHRQILIKSRVICL